MDQQAYIRAQDNRAVIVDRDDQGVMVSVHLMGGHAMCTLSIDAAIELVRGIQSIIDQGVNHE